jgi:hypothetical protein
VSPAELGRDGMIGMHAELNTLVMKVARRAENAPAEVLKAAFVLHTVADVHHPCIRLSACGWSSARRRFVGPVAGVRQVLP